MTIEQLVERTTVNPAKAVRRPELGHLSEGGVADIAVIELRKGKFGFVDAGLARLAGDRKLRCVLTLRAGRVVWDAEGLSMTEWTHAGPYSNFQ
jgi:dihydroorotase